MTRRKTAKPPHPADVYDAQQIARAASFSVFFADTRGKQAHETLSGARQAAAGNPRALVYAITPEGKTIHVPATYQAEG